MKSTDRDQTGAGDSGFGFFDRVDTGLEELRERQRKFKERWEDPIFRILLKVIFILFLIGVLVNALTGLAKWWWA